MAKIFLGAPIIEVPKGLLNLSFKHFFTDCQKRLDIRLVLCLRELEHSFFNFFEIILELAETARNEKVVIFVLAAQRRLVAVFYNWHSRYATSYLGIIRDHYIEEYNLGSKTMVVLA